MNKRGQAMTEMVFVIPLLVMLAAGVMSVVYMCWQGVKVQQAANLAARIQGQERVAGGVNQSAIAMDNGVPGSNFGDRDLKKMSPGEQRAYEKARQGGAPIYSGVYGKIQKAVRTIFESGDQSGISIPTPKYGTVGYSDKVTVQRVIVPPSFFGLSVSPQVLEGTAYGGEDSHMYGLVRWGSTNPNSTAGNNKFWTQSNNLKGND